MSISIYGAGAIGGYMGMMLQEGGADVSLIARGAHLVAPFRNRSHTEAGRYHDGRWSEPAHLS